ncbi:SURF1 family cytochrome oxidase biogenesis protein [Gordonia sp. MP11Mi]|uniref:SURF1-like protein n=1 Tax=Gordonia sp. MP11Mi TaxID=3022769 RepID=A0AA97CYZ0_9ACTN
MRVLRSFLKPGWLLLVLFVVAFAAACFAILAPWQLGKNSDTEQRNDLIRAAVDTDAVPIDRLAPPGRPLDPNNEWHEVTLRGRYLPDDQVMLRFRYSQERPAVEALTPFRISGTDRVILVNRGIVATSENGQVSVPTPPSDEVTIAARLRKSEGTSPGKEPRAEGGQSTAYTIDTAQLSRLTGVPMASYYLQLSPSQPGSLGEIDLPQLESGPFLSYGLQWLAFGVMVPLGAAYFIYSEIKARRARRSEGASDAEQGEVVAVVEAPPATSRSERERVRQSLREAGSRSGNDVDIASGGQIGDGSASAAADEAVRTKLAQRYGK